MRFQKILWLALPAGLFLDLWGLKPFGLTGLKITGFLALFFLFFGKKLSKDRYKIS